MSTSTRSSARTKGAFAFVAAVVIATGGFFAFRYFSGPDDSASPTSEQPTQQLSDAEN